MYYILHKDKKLVGISLEEPSNELLLAGITAEGIEGNIPDLNKVVFDTSTCTFKCSGV